MSINAAENDSAWMAMAIACAQSAAAQQEVPVGAILVKDGQCIAKGWNQPIQGHDPSAHAEIMAMRQAGMATQNYRLTDCTLYVTLEPCAMCLAAMVHARIARVVYGAPDPKAGACGGQIDLQATMRFNHRIAVDGGCEAETCSRLLTDFFKARRDRTVNV